VIPIPFPRLFTSDGGVVAPAVNPLVSTGVGEWIRTGNREFAIEFVALRYASPTGPVAGSSKTKVALQLNENGDELHGRFKTENFDLSGNLISTVTGTVDGKRIQIEPL
jgi:hypothetical protein